ncbi:hypothetical protein MKZ38_004226 [Zalerion maritima]|uniref:Rhodopsin domain-containing protein n=1 Tax=Zalerion maritima TaxID=339359 RepID=A0AAD5RMZ3_9PEZI|nr:hypothetical protein MKZ38_004226 [Zalerion maritima]
MAAAEMGTSVETEQSTGETKGPATLAAIWTLAALGLIALVLRVYSKRRQRIVYWADDWLLALAWVSIAGSQNGVSLVFVVIQNVCTTAAVSYGFGKRMSTIPHPDMEKMLLWMFIPPAFALLGASISKTAYAVLLLRLTVHRPIMKRILWFAIVTMNLVMFVAGTLDWAQCQPVEKGWNRAIPGKCIEPQVRVSFGISASVFSGAMDLMFAFIPWILVQDFFQRSRREKAELAGAMSLGILAAAAAFIKSVHVSKIGNMDFAWSGGPLVIWSVAETVVTIIAASAPVLRVFIREMAGMTALRSEAKNSSGSSGSSGNTPMVRRWTISTGGAPPTNATLTGGTLDRRQSIIRDNKEWYTSGRKGSQDTLVDGKPGVIRIREVPPSDV